MVDGLAANGLGPKVVEVAEKGLTEAKVAKALFENGVGTFGGGGEGVVNDGEISESAGCAIVDKSDCETAAD